MPTRRSAGVTLVSLPDPSSPWERAETSGRARAAVALTPTPVAPTTDAPPPAKRQKKVKDPRSLEVLLRGKNLSEVKAMVRNTDIVLADGTKFTVVDVTCDTDPTGRALREFNFHMKVHPSHSEGWEDHERDRVYSGKRMMEAVIL